MRRSGGWRPDVREAEAVRLSKGPFSSIKIKAAGVWACMAIVAFGISSCAPRNKAFPGVATRPVARALPVKPSDSELNAVYLKAVSELQRLNTEMNAANKARDFEAVRKRALEGLLKAQTARQVVEQLRDKALRRDRLTAIDLTIEDLERLVAITSQ